MPGKVQPPPYLSQYLGLLQWAAYKCNGYFCMKAYSVFIISLLIMILVGKRNVIGTQNI